MKRLRTERIRHVRYDEEFKTQAVRMWVDSGTSAERTAKELARLKKELARVTEHREILKKAAGIISQTPPSGLP